MGCAVAYGQNRISYYIHATLDSIGKRLTISQKISFEGISNNELDTLYFTDWPNAYSGINTPLAQRLVEEYDRSFYLSNKSKFGSTLIQSFKINGTQANWSRLDNQPDIIQLISSQKINNEKLTKIEIQYEVVLPDAKFTGYGYNDKGDIYLRYWYIALSPIFEGKWQNYSHLNLDDFSIQDADYSLKLSAPEGFSVETSLKGKTKEKDKHYFSGIQNREISVYLSRNNKFQTFQTASDRIILTDIFKASRKEEDKLEKIKKIDFFVTQAFNFKGVNKFIVPELIYDKNPFFGLNDLPKFLSPFSDLFLEEISFLKSYLHFYLTSNLPVDLRKDHWLFGGLQTYLMIKYIETYYPDQKYLGRLSRFKLMRAYTLSDIDFNEGYWIYYELMERANLQQSDFLPKNELIKFNEKIGSPYHVGIGLRYLENYIGRDSFNKILVEYLNQTDTDLSWLELLQKHSPKNINWFEKFYLKKRTPIDIKIKSLKKRNDSIEVNLTRHSDNTIPFVLSQIKNDSIVSQQWIEGMGTVTRVTLQNMEPDFVAINPEIRLPEINKMNNWKYTQNFLNFKPIQFNFMKDYESPKRYQIYYNPMVNYNLYDGLSIGSRFYDKSLKFQKFFYDFMPQYSSLEKSWVGKVKMSLRINKEEKSNYLTFFDFFASSYHYNKNLRYQVIRPSINFLFRTSDFRSNKRHVLGLYYYSVKRDSPPDPITNPNYKLFNLRYFYSNRGALKHTTFGSNVQLSGKFTKAEMTFDFRRLLANGSQFTARFFAGKFLHHNQRETQFFDFNLNRPQDYLFQYNYFGRSESKGVYSQQIVMAEGGFKSVLLPATANDYLLSTNLTMGIWKWVELYTDLGILKNQNANPHYLYGSGIRLNILPDYIEIFFPLHSTNGWEIDDASYQSKIRFILTMSPKELAGLFSRKWF